MSVFTIIQRAFPFSLPWKRRPSTSKGKENEKELESSDHDSHEEEPRFGKFIAESPSTTLHRDVSDTLHVAVKQSPGPDPTASLDDSSGESSETDSDSEPKYQTHSPSNTDAAPARSQVARVVRWASIVRSRCRWTSEQEKELQRAEKHLARCQKAWSSEQELWLAYVRFYPPERVHRVVRKSMMILSRGSQASP